MHPTREFSRIADLRPTLIYFCAAFTAIVAGLLLRFLPTSIPFLVVKYGGSFLWAVMVYFLVAAFQPFRRPTVLAGIAITLAILIELSRLYHTPGLDGFRLTLAGALLLGRIFDPWHLLVYTVAIVLSAAADFGLVRSKKDASAKDPPIR